MSVNLWVQEFRVLHARARKGPLEEGERRRYLAAREQFARALTTAQGLDVPAGQLARRTFRVAQGLQVDLSFDTGQQRNMTLDVSCGGFSVLMHKPPLETEEPGFSLRLPGGMEPLVGRVRVVSVQRKTGTHRVAFAFLGLGDKDLERLETVLFDLVLERVK